MEQDQTLTCQFCKRTLSFPIFLPCCGETICRSHTSDLFICYFCKSQVSQKSLQTNNIVYRLLEKLNNTKENLENVEKKFKSYPNALNNSLVNSLNKLEFDIKSTNEMYVNKFKEHLNDETKKKLKEGKSLGQTYIQSLIESNQTNDLRKSLDKLKEYLNKNDWKTGSELNKINDKIQDLSNKIDEILSNSISVISIKYEPRDPIDFDSIKIGEFQISHQIEELPNILLTNESCKDVNNNQLLNTQEVLKEIKALREYTNIYSNKELDKTILEDEINYNIDYKNQVIQKTDMDKINENNHIFNSTSSNKITLETSFQSNHSNEIISENKLIKIRGHHKSIKCSMFDHSFKYFITGSEDCLIKIWSLEKNMLSATLKGHQNKVNCFDINSLNKILASGSADKNVIIWDLETTKKLFTLNCHQKSVEAVKFSPQCIEDNRYLVSGGADGYVLVWSYNVRTNEFKNDPVKFKETSNTKAKVTDIEFNKGGSLMGCLVNDGSICVYKMNNLAKIADLEFGYPRINMFKFDDILNKKIRFFTAYVKESVPLSSMPLCVELKSNFEWKAIELNDRNYENFHETKDISPIKLIYLNSTSSMLITGHKNYIIKVYDVDKLNLINQFRVQKSKKVELLIMLPHITFEDILLTYGTDKDAIIWDMKNGIKQRIISMQNVGNITEFSWFRPSISSPISFYFCATNLDGELIIYNDLYELSNDRNDIIYEQFFEFDFSEVVRDQFGNLKDLKSNIETHLIPYGKLVNSKNVAYNDEIVKSNLPLPSSTSKKRIIKPLSELVVRNNESHLKERNQQEEMILNNLPKKYFNKSFDSSHLEEEYEQKPKRRRTSNIQKPAIELVINRFTIE